MTEQPIITIFCAFTRPWAVDRWLENLASMAHDPERTSLAVIIDIDEPVILRKLRAFAEKHGYRRFVFRFNEDWHPNEVRLNVRRMRIADVKNQSKHLILQCDGDYVVCFEDDTVFPDLNLKRLLYPLLTSDQVGFVQGVQCGRHDFKMIGAWTTDDPRDPHHIETMLPPAGGDYHTCHAGGFYGYATRRLLYLATDYYASSAQPWGPDVNFGLWLSRQGYEVITDWSTIFGHNDHNRILYPDSDLWKVVFTKSRETGMWDRHDIAAPQS